MNNLPIYVPILFGLTVLVGLILFYKATNNSKPFIIAISIWLIIQTLIALTGFYKIANTIPPRFGLLIIPPVIITIISFNSKKGKQFIDSCNLKMLVLFHVIRIPVELVLYWLYVHKAVPELMTFEGRNFDIFSGLSAPFIYYFGFIKNKLSRTYLLFWNFLCLLLLLNIVINALLSLPSAFQQFAFDQPNIAILQFPFVLLPSVLVPLVLFAHLAAIRQLLYNNKLLKK